MTIHPSSHHDFVKMQDSDPILEQVAVSAGKQYSLSGPLAGLFSALIIKIQTLFMDDKHQAEFISKKIHENSFNPASLRWFSSGVIEQVTTSDPSDIAKACAYTKDKTARVALAVAFLNCWEKQSAEHIFNEAVTELHPVDEEVEELIKDLATLIESIPKKSADKQLLSISAIDVLNKQLPVDMRFGKEISINTKDELSTWIVSLQKK